MIKKTIMKMCVVALLCLIHQGIATAQYNKNYQHSYPGASGTYPVNSNTLDIVNSNPYSQCALMEMTDLPTIEGFTSQENLLGLKTIDQWGSPVWEKTFRLSDSTVKVEPWRIIRSLDSGFLVVGRVTLANGNVNPFAARFDYIGNSVWTKVYTSNLQDFPDQRQTAVARVEDDLFSPESYIIVRSGSTANPQQQSNTENVQVNALRIRFSDGSLIWNRKYYDAIQTANDSAIKSYPNTITYVQNLSQSYYFIAGSHISFNSGQWEPSMFYMAIDKYGNIAHSYRTMNFNGAYPQDHDAVYDASDTSIVMSYTLKNASNYYPGISESKIILAKFNRSLQLVWQNFYTAQSSSYSRAARMTINTADDAYVIACNVKLASNRPNTIAELKTSKLGIVSHLFCYNTRSETYANSMLNADPQTGTEMYMIGGRKLNSGMSAARILQTDPTGYACGAYYPTYTEISYTFPDSLHSYDTTAPAGEYAMTLNTVGLDVVQSDCDSSSPPFFKPGRPTKTGNVEKANATKVYPTILQSGDQVIHIEADKDYANGVTVSLTSIDGRMIATSKISTGKSGIKYDWQIPNIAPGYYMVTVRTADGKVLKNEKIVKM